MLINKKWFLIIGSILTSLHLMIACQPQPVSVEPPVPGIGVDITSSECPSAGVKVGDQVTWTNKDILEHIVRGISEEGNTLFDSGVLQHGERFTYIFVEAGEYTCLCTSDGAMAGIVTVQQ